jgi:hypothetical protein
MFFKGGLDNHNLKHGTHRLNSMDVAVMKTTFVATPWGFIRKIQGTVGGRSDDKSIVRTLPHLLHKVIDKRVFRRGRVPISALAAA